MPIDILHLDRQAVCTQRGGGLGALDEGVLCLL